MHLSATSPPTNWNPSSNTGAQGVSVTSIRREPTASYAIAGGPDRLLIEIFQPERTAIPADLHEFFGLS